MINLLPPERAQAIRYGRTNARLIRWLVGILTATIGLAIIIAGGWLYVNQQSKNLQSGVDDSKLQLSVQNLPKVEASAAEISGDVKAINQVLSSEIRFSDLFRAIGKIMPSGSILGSITLTNIKGSMDLSASTADHTTAAQVAVNLGDPANGLFSKVDIVSVDCPAGSTSYYTCTIKLEALFSNDAESKFLSVAKKVGQ